MSRHFIMAEALRELAFGSVAASYSSVGTALPEQACQVILYNGLDTEVMVSLDSGSTDFMRLQAGQGMVLTAASDKAWLKCVSGKIIKVKQTAAGAPSSGQVSVSVLYYSA